MFWSKTYQFRRDKQCFTQKHVNFEEIINVLWFSNIYLLHLLTKMRFFVSVFLLFTPQNKRVGFPFNSKNDQWVKAHLFCFIYSKIDFSVSKQYTTLGPSFYFRIQPAITRRRKIIFHFWTHEWKAHVEISLFRMSNRV